VEIRADFDKLRVILNKIHHNIPKRIRVNNAALRNSVGVTMIMFLKNTESNGMIANSIG
jgi:hypothetical protein